MKKSGQFLFESKLKWEKETTGTLTGTGITEPIKVAPPKILKGLPDATWSAEHLLISAVSSCFMTTCLFYAKLKGLALTGFQCEAIGQVELKYGKLKFTSIHIYPVIEIEKKELEKKATAVIELTKQNCLVSKAISAIIYYHPTIQITGQAPAKKVNTAGKK